MKATVYCRNLFLMVLLGLSLIDAGFISGSKYFDHCQAVTCDNLIDYVDTCYGEFFDRSISGSYKSTPVKGCASCCHRIPFCFQKRLDMNLVEMAPELAQCVSKFEQGSDCNATTIYDKCCKLPFQHSGNTCPPINYGDCEFTTCTPFGVQCNPAFRCVAPLGFGCDTDSDCISGLFCTNCVCSPQPPVNPPATEPPVTPPTTPSVAPPTTPPVPPATGALYPILDCVINDGVTCTAVFGYWNQYNATLEIPIGVNNRFSPSPINRGQVTDFEANSIIFRAFNVSRPCSGGSLAWILTDPISGLTRTVIAGTNPGNSCSVVPPVVPTSPQLNCTNNGQISVLLQQCQLDCGPDCTICGQVWSFCEENGVFTANFTIDTCATIVLNNVPTSEGFCPFLSALDTCCDDLIPPVTAPVEPPIVAPVAPPVTIPIPPVDCLDNNVTISVLETCEAACGGQCQFCGQVFSYCEDFGFLDANFTVETCATVILDFIPVSDGCPYNQTLSTCCGIPPPPPVVCVNNTAAEEVLIQCQTDCGTACPFCGDVFSFCMANQSISANFTLDTCLTVTLEYIPTNLGLCPFASSLANCCENPVPPIAPPVTPALVVDCVDNDAVVALLDTCQTECGPDCDFCGQVFSYCTQNGFISANFTLNACKVIYLDFIPTNVGACPFNDTLEFCCSQVEPPVPIIPIAPPDAPVPVPPMPEVDCTENDEIATLLGACQTLCGPECDYCGQVYTYCSDNGVIDGNFTIDACLVIHLDFIPTSAGSCPFNDTLICCCDQVVEPPVPIVTRKQAKCSFKQYNEAHYCMQAYQELSCDQRLIKCQDYVLNSVESDESRQCLMNKMARSKDSETCHFVKALDSCC